jgi:hypothetical protein
MKNINTLLMIFVISGLMLGCKCKEKSSSKNEANLISTSGTKINSEKIASEALPHIIIYKTKKDYSKQVPVLMNKDKNDIVSYPAPSDLKISGSYAVPTPLSEGYLLDNRGIGPNVAFLDITYQQYSELKEVPAKDYLISKIIDRNPLVEMWDCGQRTETNPDIKKFNELIRNKFPNCKKIVITLEEYL